MDFIKKILIQPGGNSNKLVNIIKSPRTSKKWRAIFSDGTHTDFGATGYEDYTIHHDKTRRLRYRQRHIKDKILDYKSPGCLSWYILWGESVNMKACIKLYKKRFNI